MAFNWFNRQFADSDASQDQASETDAPQDSGKDSDSEGTETAEEETTEQTNAKYLNWAKAAYKNFNAQRQAVLGYEQETEQTDPEPDKLTEADPDASQEPEVPQETVATETVAPETAAAESQTETSGDPVVESKSSALEDAIPSNQPDPISVGDSPNPPEKNAPVNTVSNDPGATTAPSDPTSEVEFDEGFLWSAEVLAAQGRRPDQVSQEEITWLQRLRQGLDKTRLGLVNQLKGVVGQGPLNQDAVMEIESLLLQADVGIEATDFIIGSLQERLREETLPPEEAIAYLKSILRDILDEPLGQEKYSGFYPEKGTFNVWLMTGVNGAGKTTTIGKLAHLAKKSDYRCLIAAADTFRAAAVEQVKVWGERSNVEVVANPGKNTDPAAVVFDAITAAQARDAELLLVDTAGRLQNKKNLMDELGKIRRIVDKKAPDAQIESLLVLDATLGQNGLRQAEVFSQAAQLSGVVLTKLDGSARGGIALAIVRQLGLPIRFIGAGEGIEDLRPFSSYEFVEALLEG